MGTGWSGGRGVELNLNTQARSVDAVVAVVIAWVNRHSAEASPLRGRLKVPALRLVQFLSLLKVFTLYKRCNESGHNYFTVGVGLAHDVPIDGTVHHARN